MKINTLIIEGIGGIKELQIDFNQGFNVICGMNGVGKTTILNIIADVFVSSKSTLKRNADFKEGKYAISYMDIRDNFNVQSKKITKFEPIEVDYNRSTNESAKK